MHRPGRSRSSGRPWPGPVSRASAAAPGVYPIDSGTAELIRDRDRPRGFLLLVNGEESSYADLDDPAWLEFEYLRWMAAVIATHQHEVVDLDVVHLGAAGCSLARHLLAERPTSRHLAVDIDARLAALVREWFVLPRAPSLRIRIGDARAVTASLPAASADVVVRDVFAGSVTPAELTTVEFTQEVRRVLRPGGLYLLNCADRADLALARAEAATMASVFAHTAVAADPPMLKGRRRGNVVVAGSATPIAAAELARSLRAGEVPAGLWDDDEVAAFAKGLPTLRDDAGARSSELMLHFLRNRQRAATFAPGPEPQGTGPTVGEPPGPTLG